VLDYLTNADVIDVAEGRLLAGRTVRLEHGRVAAVTEERPRPGAGRILDLGGLTLIPGLIDCHCHVMQSTTNLALLAAESPLYAAARAFEIMQGMLQRGFTTIRDAGGADFGIAKAVEEGRVPGPRIFYCGKALTATGGHGDYRSAGQYAQDESYWVPRISRLCEGVTALRAAVRDEVRKGAHHIKIMANGGVASPTDRITSDQYSEEEIGAVVDEAEMAGLYVASHTYTARSIARAVRCGVRSIEHGNLADDETLALMKQAGSFLVPTLVVFRALAEEGVADGLPAELTGKLGDMFERGLGVVEKAHRLGIPMAFGSDLIGGMHRRQSEEFALRADVVPAADLLRSATLGGARLLRREAELGQIAPGFLADLVAVDGNPLEDIRLLADPERRFRLIVKGGAVVKNTLDGRARE
jgi:imidazolonepropionase-like amidohydrolase